MLGLIYHFQRDVVREGEGIGLGDPVVAPRRVIALPTDARQRQRLLEISRSRTEPTGRVERARIILAYLDDPSLVPDTAGTLGTHKTGSLHESALSVRHLGRSMNGLRAGMSAPPLMAAARVAAGVRAKSLRLPGLSRTAAVDPNPTFTTSPAGSRDD